MGKARLSGAVLATVIFLGLGATLPAAVRPLSFEELTQKSKYVITGTVVGMHSYLAPFVAGGECIVTDVTLKVEEALKGKPDESELTFQFLGGRLADGDWQICHESPRFEQGERVLVFLRQYRGRLWNTGWLQGKYALSSDGKTVRGRMPLPIATDLSLERVRGQVRLYAATPVVNPSSVQTLRASETAAETSSSGESGARVSGVKLSGTASGGTASGSAGANEEDSGSTSEQPSGEDDR